MSARRPLLAIAAIGFLGRLGVTAVSADPASSADSAWSPLPAERDGAPSDPLERRGREVFDQRCAACHGEIPEETFGPRFLPSMPGTQALRDRYGDALPAALERRTDLTPEYIEAVVRDGLRSMPFFRPTEVSDEDLEALAAYLTRDRAGAGE
ncbi:MAG TPA: cytochrome c [Gammaproteobacteria bacterium]